MKGTYYFTIADIDYYLDKVYLEYEQPELFTVCNAVGGIYLVMLVDCVNEKWLMMPISAAKLRSLEYGKIYIKDAFTNPEINISIVDFENGQFISRSILPQNIDNDYLPIDDARLNWNDIPMPNIKDDIYDMAASHQRDVFDIRVISEETTDHTIDVKNLGSLLLIINDTVKTIAKERNKKAGKKRGSTMGCSLRYVGNYAGSFGIRLESAENSDLLDETKLTPILKELFDLLKIDSLESVSKTVKEKSFAYSGALRKLLKYSYDNNAGLNFSFTTPRSSYQGEAIWKSDFSKDTLNYLDKLISEEIKEEEYVGTLVAITTKQYKFSFITNTEEEIKGRIDESLREFPFTVKSYAKIKIKKTIKINNANETEETFCLIDYKKLS